MNLLSRWLVACLVTIPGLLVAQRDLKQIPDPDPQKELASFQVHPDCRVNLFVSDPAIAKPIQMNFDAEGRLWIASSEVYPQIKPGEKPTDKILVVEDKDGDGKADLTRVFADGLLIPTGVLPGDGGVYVVNSTELLHLSDTDGDGKADRRRVVLSGFGAEDTHHLLHTLRWGPDGALYMNQSIYIHSHIETPWGVRHLNGGGIWRFEPQRMRLEVLARGFVNPWGHHFDQWGQSFATDGAYREGINYVFPDSVFVTAPGATRTVRGLNPGSPKHCGLELVSGRHFPPNWQGLCITNDFRGNRTCRFQLSENGSAYLSKQLQELIVSTHMAYRPIDAKMGPDGALYIADWYNPIIQHGEVDFRDPRRDHQRGRIWRVTFKNRPLLKPPAITGAPIPDLLELLKAPEDWTRLFAKLELKTRPAGVVTRELSKWVEQLDRKHPGYTQRCLEALWASYAVGKIDHALLDRLLTINEPRVRAAALRIWSYMDHDTKSNLKILERAIADEFPRVRLEAVTALAKEKDRHAIDLAMRALDAPMDSYLDFAVWNTVRQLGDSWLPAVETANFEFARDRNKLLFALNAIESPSAIAPLLKRLEEEPWTAADRRRATTTIGRYANPNQVGQYVALLGKQTEDHSPSLLAEILLTLATETRTRRMKPPGNIEVLSTWMSSDDAALIQAVLECGATWQVPKIADLAFARAQDKETSIAIRLAAIRAIGTLNRPERLTVLKRLSQDHFEAIRWQAMAEMIPIALAEASRTAAGELEKLTAKDDPAPVLAAFRGRPKAMLALANSLRTKKLNPDLARKAARIAANEGTAGHTLRDALIESGRLKQNTWQVTPSFMKALIAQIANDGDPAIGEQIYRRDALQCIRCHAISGAGGNVGPDLVSIGASAPVDYLIESLLEPNKKIKENFHSLVVMGTDGRVYTGIPIQRTDEKIVLRDAQGTEVTLPTDAIEAIKDGQSLMPIGAVNELTREELTHLIRFLTELGKPGAYAASRLPVVRRWEFLEPTPEGNRRLNRTSFDTAATRDPALTWRPVFSTVSGDLPLQQLPTLKPHRETPATLFLRCELDVDTSGTVGLNLGSIEGVTLWIDGKPTPMQAPITVPLLKGRHLITIAIDRSKPRLNARIELVPVAGSRGQSHWRLQ